jgi:hypothetical protein
MILHYGRRHTEAVPAELASAELMILHYGRRHREAVPAELASADR